MTRHVMKLPDLGEGTVSAEVIAWKVKPGDVIREDSPPVEMSPATMGVDTDAAADLGSAADMAAAEPYAPPPIASSTDAKYASA